MPGLVRSGSQFVLPDLFGRVRLALNSSASTVASAVFDSLGVQRHGSGALASGVVHNAYGTGDEDGLAGFLTARGIHGELRAVPAWVGRCSPGEIVDCELTCMKKGKVMVSCFRAPGQYHCICLHPIVIPPCPPFC